MKRRAGFTMAWLQVLVAVFICCGIACRREAPTPPPQPPASDASSQVVPVANYPAWLRTAQQQNRAALPISSRSPTATSGFEQNIGQFAGDAKFVARIGDGVVLLRPGVISTVLAAPEPLDAPAAPDSSATAPSPAAAERPVRSIDLRLVGARDQLNMRSVGMLSSTISYFQGSDPKGWFRQVPAFERVVYEAVYPGIDLAMYRVGEDVKYDFIVAPGSPAAPIQMKIEGAEQVGLDSAGDLVIRAGGSELRHRKPTIYQDAQGTRKSIQGEFVVQGGVVSFKIGAYDPRLALVIDPTMVQRYSNLLGGGAFGHAKSLAVAVAPDGEVFVTGWVNVFSSMTAFSRDAFVTWFDGAAGTLLKTAVFSGTKTCSQTPNICDDQDAGTAVTVDTAGSVYVTGFTQSITFPTTADAFDKDCGDDKLCGRGTSFLNPVKSDAFVLRLDRAAGLAPTWGTFLGGGVEDGGTGIAVDSSGTIFVAGWTHSGTFPVKSAAQSAWNGNNDGFVVALAPAAASKMVFGTYLGSGGEDFATAIAFDPVRNLIFVAGSTAPLGGTSFPATDPLGPTPPGGGGRDAFVAQFDTTGKLLLATYVRGTGDDVATGVAVDGSGHVYVSGTSGSSNLNGAGGPTAGGSDGFVAKLNFVRKGLFRFARLEFVSLLGGSDEDTGTAIAVDDQGRAYLTGMTRSTNFPTAGTPQAPLRSTKAAGQTCGTQNLSCPDAYAARFTSTGALDYVALFGGQSFDSGNGIALRHAGDAVVASESFNFSAAIPHWEAFVTRIATGSDLAVTKSCTPNPVHAGHTLTCTLTITNNGPDALVSTTLVDEVSPSGWFVPLAVTTGTGCATSTNAQGLVDRVTCPVINLAAAASRTFTYPIMPATKGTLHDRLSVNFADDWNPSNNAADVFVNVEAVTDLNAFKAHVPEPTQLGSETKYEMWVGNQGPDLATAVQIKDDIPANIEVISVVPGAGTCSPTQGVGPFTIACDVGSLVQPGPGGPPGTQAVGVQIRARAKTAGTFTNKATVSGLVSDPTPANDSTTDTLTVIVGRPLIVVRLQPIGRSPAPGGINLQAEMEFTNSGNGNAYTVRTTQLDAVNIIGTGTVTRVGALPADFPLIEAGHAKSRVPVFLVTPGVTQFEAVFQGDYEDASGSGVKIRFKGSVKIVP